MSILTQVAIVVVALLHVGFLVLEMFLWEKPIGLKIFRQTRSQAAASRVLAANQGLYNGFLAAGLFWGVSLGAEGTGVSLFFLCCVILAGVFGAFTASIKILYFQALPAAIALFLLLFG